MALLTDNLSIYLSFNEASGSFLDSSGNTNTGVPSGSPTRPAAVISNGVHLVSASSQYVEIADAASVRWGNYDSSLGFWVKLANKSSTKWALNKGNSSGTVCEIGFNYNASTDRFTFFVGQGGAQKVVTANNFGSPTAGVWYYVLCDFNHTTGVISISINNGTADTTSSVSAPTGGTQTMVFGGFSGHDFLADVDFDEFGKWDRLLDSTDRAALYNSGAGFAYPFTTGGLPFFLQADILSGNMQTLAGGML